MTEVKICGLRRVEDALIAAEAGASMIGFIFAPSRRRVTPELARDIIAEVRRMHDIRAVGIFVNASPAEIGEVVRTSGLDYAQLSGDENDDTVRAMDLPVIRTLHVGPDTSPERLRERALVSPAQMILLDTARAGTYGGTGETFDWARIPVLDKPVLLAGGLHSGNVAHAIRAVRPWGVDVSSGVETDGEKDQAKIREFVLTASSTRV